MDLTLPFFCQHSPRSNIQLSLPCFQQFLLCLTQSNKRSIASNECHSIPNAYEFDKCVPQKRKPKQNVQLIEIDELDYCFDFIIPLSMIIFHTYLEHHELCIYIHIYICICIIICMKWPCFVNDPWWPNPPFYGWIAPIHGGTEFPMTHDLSRRFHSEYFNDEDLGSFGSLAKKALRRLVSADRIRQGRWLVLECFFFFGGMQQFKSHLLPQSKHSTSDDKGFSTT